VISPRTRQLWKQLKIFDLRPLRIQSGGLIFNIKKETMKIVNIQALKVREGKPQHLAAGRVYSVTSDKAAILIRGKQAVEAETDMEAGKVYDLPESEAAKDFKKKSKK